MPRKASPPRAIGPDWFLSEWMAAKQVSQADLVRLTGWSKATVNDIFHGRTEYYRAILNQVAAALSVQPWELLMHPAEANAILSMRDSAIRIAAEQRAPFTPAPVDQPAERLAPRGVR